MKNNTELPEILKYYVKQMKDDRSNTGTRVQYKTLLIDICDNLRKEIEEFDKNHIFKQRK